MPCPGLILPFIWKRWKIYIARWKTSKSSHIRYNGEVGTFRALLWGWAEARQDVSPHIRIRSSDNNQNFIILDPESPWTTDLWKLKISVVSSVHKHSAVNICYYWRQGQPRPAILTLYIYHEKKMEKGLKSSTWLNAVIGNGIISKGLHIRQRSQNHLNKAVCFPDGKDCLYLALVQ